MPTTHSARTPEGKYHFHKPSSSVVADESHSGLTQRHGRGQREEPGEGVCRGSSSGPRWHLLVFLRSAAVPLMSATVCCTQGTLQTPTRDALLGGSLDSSTEGWAGRTSRWDSLAGSWGLGIRRWPACK